MLGAGYAPASREALKTRLMKEGFRAAVAAPERPGRRSATSGRSSIDSATG